MNELDMFYEEVKKVAYDMYESRGRIHGYDMEDWLEAEMIVQKRYLKKIEQAHSLDRALGNGKVQKKAKAKAGK